jgi:hypothetical protein
MIDFTSYRVFIQRHRALLVPVVCGLAIFMAGWQVGRATSPYSHAASIVFEDRPCSDCTANSGGDTQALKDLQAQGDAMADKAAGSPAPTVAAKTASAPAVKGASDTTAAAATVPATGGKFVASKNSNLYHYYTCPSAKRIKADNQRWFATAQEAEAAGLQPSKCTLDKGVK